MPHTARWKTFSRPAARCCCEIFSSSGGMHVTLCDSGCTQGHVVLAAALANHATVLGPGTYAAVLQCYWN